MPAFGSNAVTCAFARRVLYEPVRGFRLSDRIQSALDRFLGALTRFRVPGEALLSRWLFLYPFVGGADWTHALNLADLEGNFTKFTMTYSGTVTHHAQGITLSSGGGAWTNCDCADAVNNYEAWNRKSYGAYFRTNSALNTRDISASFVEPKNGYTYFQGIIPRAVEGTCQGNLCSHYKAGVTFTYSNFLSVAVSDSLGLITDNQRGPTTSYSSHFLYKRGVLIGSENSDESGMGYGDAGSNAIMYLNGSRAIGFFFSTKHQKTFSYPGLPGNNEDFNYFVEQLQVALQRNV